MQDCIDGMTVAILSGQAVNLIHNRKDLFQNNGCDRLTAPRPESKDIATVRPAVYKPALEETWRRQPRSY